MPPLTIMLKPASSACNMQCSYCFYNDVAKNRKVGFKGMISEDLLEVIISRATAYAQHSCTFIFQGGEPTLAGLSFYKSLINLQNKYKKPGLKVYNCLQTNGYAIDEKWARFFVKNDFLVGLSLDGPSEIHNLNRKDNLQRDTFNRVMKAVTLFNRERVKYNILCVVTGFSAKRPEKLYNFYKKQGFLHLQFIPCLDFLENPEEHEPFTLLNKDYEHFLLRIFDLWFEDLKKGLYISIRHIDNWLLILSGRQPEACNMSGKCSVQPVIEGDGSVFPCDFYATDKYHLGNIKEHTFFDLLCRETARDFVEASQQPQECTDCPYFLLCRNGCLRERCLLPDNRSGKNRFCEAYKTFFNKRQRQLSEALIIMERMFFH